MKSKQYSGEKASPSNPLGDWNSEAADVKEAIRPSRDFWVLRAIGTPGYLKDPGPSGALQVPETPGKLEA